MHFLWRVPPNIALSDLVRKSKQHSTIWVNNDSSPVNLWRHFSWDTSYTAMAIGPNNLNTAHRYLDGQGIYHKDHNYAKELAGFLKHHNITYKPQFLLKNTFHSIPVHLVWATKHREAILEKTIRLELFEFIAEQTTSMKLDLMKIGGVEDHLHLLLRVPPKWAVSDLVKIIKTKAATWLQKNSSNYRNFSWQEDFGGFSVDVSNIGTIENYIENQEEHHRQQSFDEEWKIFQRFYGLN